MIELFNGLLCSDHKELYTFLMESCLFVQY